MQYSFIFIAFSNSSWILIELVYFCKKYSSCGRIKKYFNMRRPQYFLEIWSNSAKNTLTFIYLFYFHNKYFGGNFLSMSPAKSVGKIWSNSAKIHYHLSYLCLFQMITQYVWDIHRISSLIFYLINLKEKRLILKTIPEMALWIQLYLSSKIITECNNFFFLLHSHRAYGFWLKWSILIRMIRLFSEWICSFSLRRPHCIFLKGTVFSANTLAIFSQCHLQWRLNMKQQCK